MIDTKITLIVEGMERDQGHVRLEVFVKELSNLYSLLTKADEAASGGVRNAHFKIVALSHASPATATIRADLNPRRADTRAQAFAVISRLIESVDRDSIPPDVDYSMLQDIGALAQPIGATLRHAEIKLNGASFVLAERTAALVAAHLTDVETCWTTFEGMLEKINVHDDADSFTIYPDVGPKRISCHFRHELVEKAISALKRRVAVSGLAKYRKYDQFPNHIDVEGIEIYGLESDLANFDNLRGVAPDATGSLTSEAFVRDFRNGWQ